MLTHIVVLSILGYFAIKYPAFMRLWEIVLTIVVVVALLIALKIGFISALLEASLMIPVNFFNGVFGIAYHLLFD